MNFFSRISKTGNNNTSRSLLAHNNRSPSESASSTNTHSMHRCSFSSTAAIFTSVASAAIAFSPILVSSLQTSSSSSAASCANPNTSSNMPNLRSVKRILKRPYPHWVGDGFHVFPVFADLAFKEELSPLLMFDYGAPKKFEPSNGKPRGVGQHPHRGFETVTIAFQGEVEHHDNKGGHDIIGPGDIQWMTAGSGIIHQEYHSKEFTKNGGTFEMCQLWVNLPKEHKMTKPKYQPIQGSKVPIVTLADGAAQVRLIAGELGDTTGAASTFSPVQMWDVSLPKAGSEVDIPYPPEHNCIVFVRRGSVEVNGKALGPQDVAVMRMDGSDTLRLSVKEDDSSVLVMGGEPLNEPIAAQGPFVMNTQKELGEAMMDFHRGKF